VLKGLTTGALRLYLVLSLVYNAKVFKNSKIFIIVNTYLIL